MLITKSLDAGSMLLQILLRPKQLLFLFFLLLALMLVVTLYPFNFFNPNGVEWLKYPSGIYLNGKGMAKTKGAFDMPQKELSVEILLNERNGSKNWGAREIFSICDHYALPSILIGQRGDKLFVYNSFEKGKGVRWYKQLFLNTPPRGKPYLVTVLINSVSKAIYINGELRSKQVISPSDMGGISLSGQFIIGNSPSFESGWMGEVRGLAVFNRVLSGEEISLHNRMIFKGDISKLAKTSGCIALYLFEKGEERIIENTVDPSKPLLIPKYTHSMPNTIFHLPYNDMRGQSLIGPPVKDFFKNILFFLPFGIVLSLVFSHNIKTNHLLFILLVALSGGLFSFLIEFMQTFLISRIAAIADVISNMIGSVIGALFVFYIREPSSGAS